MTAKNAQDFLRIPLNDPYFLWHLEIHPKLLGVFYAISFSLYKIRQNLWSMKEDQELPNELAERINSAKKIIDNYYN